MGLDNISVVFLVLGFVSLIHIKIDKQPLPKEGGQRAASKGYNETYNGIEYKIYLNKKTGEVQNVHPR